MKNIKDMTWEEENVIMEKMFKEAEKKDPELAQRWRLQFAALKPDVIIINQDERKKSQARRMGVENEDDLDD